MCVRARGCVCVIIEDILKHEPIFVQVFDNGKGCISVHDLRVIMLNLGDGFTEEEVDEMVEEADVKNGLINIKGMEEDCKPLCY